MDLDTLAKLGEFVGGFFVVVSLVYLAHQVRQNTNSLQSENYARVLDRMSMVQSNLATNPELNRLVVVGAQQPDELTRSDRIRFSWAMYELLGAGEFMYHQAKRGALPAQVWERWSSTIAWWMANPGIQAWWKAKPTPLSADFEDFVAERIRNGVEDPAAIERWEAFVTGGASPTGSGPA